VPHANGEEDTYNGYTIPLHSIVIPNVWYVFRVRYFFINILRVFRFPFRRKMMLDPKHFSNPEDFNPERFREKLESITDPTKALNGLDMDDPTSIVFGFGKR
jgi:hypothetical protein